MVVERAPAYNRLGPHRDTTDRLVDRLGREEGQNPYLRHESRYPLTGQLKARQGIIKALLRNSGFFEL
jgi:hypothetical protein